MGGATEIMKNSKFEIRNPKRVKGLSRQSEWSAFLMRPEGVSRANSFEFRVSSFEFTV
jgi:hypothetical protein